MSTATLLVELFTEELPPKALKVLGEVFADQILNGLVHRNFKLRVPQGVGVYATPRRLAVTIPDVLSESIPQSFETKLMPVAIALDAGGKPTKALLKKLAALGLTESDVTGLVRKFDGKADVFFHSGTTKPLPLAVGLQAVLAEAIEKLPIPKLMSYQLADGETTVQFVRPAHGLVALHGTDVVPVHALGLHAGRTTHGHRFQGAVNIELKDADEYESRLDNEGGVIASFDKRRVEIMRLLFAHAEQTGDTLGELEDYAALLDEVTGLVERPTVYVGKFDAEFLEVPAECLVLTMKLNQKYFPLFLSEGGLSSRFLIVSNMRLDNPQNVIEGNQRVVRPRLADARFFFETDKKTRLADRIPKLASVVYHNQLGSQGERVERVQAIARAIAGLASNDLAFNKRVDHAAHLAKADLVTDMVGEFPELQGTMGKYYALHEGISRDVAEAIEDHYKPRFAGDALPRNDVGVIVALADKLETLVGMFAIGQLPSGDKDPFALRRHAIGVVRILVDKQLPINISQLVGVVVQQFGSTVVSQGAVPNIKPVNSATISTGVPVRVETASEVKEFIFERFAGMLKEQGYSTLEVDAVLSLRPERLGDVANRLKAVRAFALLPEAKSLAAANKRIGNILKKSEGVVAEYSKAKMQEPAEISLAKLADRVIPNAIQSFEVGEYEASLCEFAKLREPLDIFFEQVMVNADDPEVRANRLGLLATLHREMNRIADLSKLAA